MEALRDNLVSTLENSVRSDGALSTVANDPTGPGQHWSTAQAAAALLEAGGTASRDQQRHLLRHLVDAQAPDGGWRLYDEDPWSITEVSAWAVLALQISIQKQHIWSPQEKQVASLAVKKGRRFLIRSQKLNGGWGPILNCSATECKTYSTCMALLALLQLSSPTDAEIQRAVSHGVAYLITEYAPLQKGWHGAFNKPLDWTADPALTPHVLVVLLRVRRTGFRVPNLHNWYSQWLLTLDTLSQRHIDQNDIVENKVPSTEGTARYRYFRDGVTVLWLPWTILALREGLTDGYETSEELDLITHHLNYFTSRAAEAPMLYKSAETYKIAELLHALASKFP